jgi:methionine-R-sulfoxide reductase
MNPSFMILFLFLLTACGHATMEQPPLMFRYETLMDTVMTDKVVKTDAEWRSLLTAEEYKILRGKGTEFPFRGKYNKTTTEGIYTCAGCGNPLFHSDTKYDSGSGWPSFWQPIREESIKEVPDNSYFMNRIEVVCARCEGHLGHVFDDGPRPTGLRYCLNSPALKLVEKP